MYLALLISDVHPTNSGNWSNLSHLTCNATLAPSLSLFLLVIVVVLLHHRRRSSPTLFDTRHPSSQQLGSGSTLFFYKNIIFFPKPLKEIQIATSRITTMFLIFELFQGLMFLYKSRGPVSNDDQKRVSSRLTQFQHEQSEAKRCGVSERSE